MSKGMASHKIQCLNLYSKDPSNSEERATKRAKIEDNAHEVRDALLDKTEKTLHKLMELIGDGEPRLWLTADIGALNVNDSMKFSRFNEALANKMDVNDDTNKNFIDQVLLLCCQKLPQYVARIFKYRASVLRRFFEDDTMRVRKWFNHFKFSGNNLFGAVGLEKYLFEHREEYWSRLRWIGKRDVPPCVAVHKKNLFLELDVVTAVQMLADDDDKFWSSPQFQEDLESGML